MFYPYKKELQTGVHAVTNAPERVIVDCMFSLNIPVGMTYTADKDQTCVCDEQDNHYLLQAQKSNNVNFRKAENSSINISINSAMVLGIYGIDKSTVLDKITETISEFVEVPQSSLKKKKANKDMILLLHRKSAGHYKAFLITRKSTDVFGISIVFKGNDPDVSTEDREKFVNELLDSIETTFIEEVPTAEKLQELDATFKETFKSQSYFTLEKEVRFPVPLGYRSFENTGDWRLAVVPNNYDTSSVVFSPKMGYSIITAADSPVQYSRKNATQVLQIILNALQALMPGFMPTNLPIITAKVNDKGIIVYQYGLNNDRTRYNTSALIFTGSKFYVVTFAITMGKAIPRAKVEWDIHRILHAWFNQMLFVGESAPKAVRAKSTVASAPSMPAANTREIKLRSVYPDKELYPHYLSLGNTSKPRTMGGNTIIVTNSGGSEFQAIPFSRAIENSEEDEAERLERIIEGDRENTFLTEKATEMQPLFHVESSVFEANSDRENEIQHGLIRRAYMINALRSFAWTVADICASSKITPDALTAEECQQIVEFIASGDYLNYDKTLMPGLCGCPDLHVFYVPDSASKKDTDAFLPSEEDYDRVKRMQAAISTYNEILSSVASIDQLRKDLEYVYPAVRTLYDQLAAKRNFKEPLTGDAADIIYTWCVFALAARECFFSEDGPSRYFYDQIKRSDADLKKASQPTQGKKGTTDAGSRAKSASTREIIAASLPFEACALAKKYRPMYDKRDRRSEEHPLGCDVCFVDYYDAICELTREEVAEKILAIGQKYAHAENENFNQLIEVAEQYAGLFHVDDAHFDPKSDREAEIHKGYIKHVYALHAFRSFVYTGDRYCVKKKADFLSFSIEEIVALADFVEANNGINYRYDNRGISSLSSPFVLPSQEDELYYEPDCDLFFWRYITWHAKSKNANCANYKATQDSLILLQPIMQKIYDYLKQDRDPTQPLTGTIADILAVWCTMVLAARHPFALVKGLKDYSLERYDSNDSTHHLAVKEATKTVQNENGFEYCDDILIRYVGNNPKATLPESIRFVCSGKLATWGNIKELTVPFDCKDIILLSWGDYFNFNSDNNVVEKLIFSSPNLTLPDGLLHRAYLPRLNTLVLPEGLKSIGESALEFARLTDYPTVYITIPQSVTHIDGKAFGYYRKKIDITVYKGSYAETHFKPSTDAPVHVIQTPEQIAEQKRQKEEAEQQRKLAEQRRQEEERRRREEEQRRREEEARRLAAQKEEAERRLAAQKREYQALLKKKEEAEKEIEENKGLFGEKAKRRKAAKERLAEIEAQMAAFDPAAKQ